MKRTMIFLVLYLVSLAGFSQHDHVSHSDGKQTEQQPKFKDEKLGKVYAIYIQLKDALVASDPKQAKKTAAELQRALSFVPEAKTVMTAVSKVVAATDLEGQRIAFSGVSNEMSVLVKKGKLTSGTLYVEYCPMANNSNGGYWLSNEKEIRNPYFGEKMLQCGVLKEIVQ